MINMEIGLGRCGIEAGGLGLGEINTTRKMVQKMQLLSGQWNKEH